MARYTRFLTVAVPLSRLYQEVTELLERCDFEILFFKEDCLIARQIPGQVPFAKLVTVEVLVDSTRATHDISKLSVVVKNEELPLQSNNYCFQVFEKLSRAIADNKGWKLVKNGTGFTTPNVETPPASVESPSIKHGATPEPLKAEIVKGVDLPKPKRQRPYSPSDRSEVNTPPSPEISKAPAKPVSSPTPFQSK